MDTAAGQGLDLIASTRDRKENRSASVSLRSEAGTVAFWERYTSCSGHRPSYSLPLAWHEINCAPLKPFKGRHLPLCILLLWSLPLPATWNVVWHLWLDPRSLRVTHIALNFMSLCAAPKHLLFPSYRGALSATCWVWR